MPFEPGNKLSTGRPPGAIGLKSKRFQEVLEKHHFCPATALIECYNNAKKTYDNYGMIYEAITDASEEKARERGYQNVPPEDNAHKYLKIAADIAKDLAGYSYPKLKAIEQSSDVTKDMTPEQRLEAMRQAVVLLELQLKKNGA